MKWSSIHSTQWPAFIFLIQNQGCITLDEWRYINSCLAFSVSSSYIRRSFVNSDLSLWGRMAGICSRIHFLGGQLRGWYGRIVYLYFEAFGCFCWKWVFTLYLFSYSLFIWVSMAERSTWFRFRSSSSSVFFSWSVSQSNKKCYQIWPKERKNINTYIAKYM